MASHRAEACLRILRREGRLAEATLFAHTFLPRYGALFTRHTHSRSALPETAAAWKEGVAKDRETLAERLAPVEDHNESATVTVA